jgi:hypothetical protein
MPDAQYPTTAATRMEPNAAMGLDHFVVPWVSGTSKLDDCGVQSPNTIYVGTNSSLTPYLPGMRKGLITGPNDNGDGTKYADGGLSRLRRIPSVTGWQSLTVGGITLDNQPLWAFIPTGTPPSNSNYPVQIPSQCYRSNITNENAMESCLLQYAGPSNNGPGGQCYPAQCPPVFTLRSTGTPSDLYDIQMSARVAFVPHINIDGSCGSSSGPPASSSCHVLGFNMIYLETAYATSSDDGGALFKPGEGISNGPLNNWSSFDGVSALKVWDNMRPASVVAEGATGVGGSLLGSRVALVK